MNFDCNKLQRFRRHAMSRQHNDKQCPQSVVVPDPGDQILISMLISTVKSVDNKSPHECVHIGGCAVNCLR